jgi:hypothetical protein
MENHEALLHVHPNGTVSVELDRALAPGDYTAELTAIRAVAKSGPQKWSILDDLPIHHVPWNEDTPVRREDMYD